MRNLRRRTYVVIKLADKGVIWACPLYIQEAQKQLSGRRYGVFSYQNSIYHSFLQMAFVFQL